MSATWSAGQQKLLSAMGYALYARPGFGAGIKATAETVGSKTAPLGVVAPAPVSTATGSGAGRLLESLRRAAGDADIAELVPDIAALRCDPRLKRALWPRLRALRSAGCTSGAGGRMPVAPAGP